MNRVVVLASLIFLVAVSAKPLLTTQTNLSVPQSTRADVRSDPADLATTRPDDAAPTFSLIRGREGFWRVGRDDRGIWWLISPEGNAEFLNTVTTVQPYQLARDPNGPSYVSRDYDGGTTNDGNIEAWAQAAIKRVRDAGFKGLGAWCHPVFHRFDIPIMRDLNVWTWMPSGSRRFFSPEWASTAEHAIKVQVELLKDNPQLIGYFIDNELDWGDGGSGPGLYFDHLPANDPNRQEVIRVIRSIWPTADEFNKDWNAQIADLKELETVELEKKGSL